MKKIIFVLIVVMLLLSSNAHAMLVGYWSFDENTGNTVYDTSGSGNDGTFQPGTTAWASGKYGSALEFYGMPADSVTIPDSASFHFSDSFTIMTWVKPDTSTPLKVVLSKYNPGDPVTFLLRQNQFDNGKWEATLDTNNGTTHAIVLSNSPIQIGVWQNLAATYDGNSLQLYVNGIMENSTPTTGNLYIGNEPVLIGGQTQGQGDTNPFDGIIDEVRIYNHALTEDEISRDLAFNNTTSAVPEPSTMLLLGAGLIGVTTLRKRKK